MASTTHQRPLQVCRGTRITIATLRMSTFSTTRSLLAGWNLFISTLLLDIIKCVSLDDNMAAIEVRVPKRTPDNLYPDENSLNPFAGWDCTNILQQSYGGGTAKVYHETEIPAWHPYLKTLWNGTCDAGQLTLGGLEDAIQHGKVRLLDISLLLRTHTL